jgi:putative transposase
MGGIDHHANQLAHSRQSFDASPRGRCRLEAAVVGWMESGNDVPAIPARLTGLVNWQDAILFAAGTSGENYSGIHIQDDADTARTQWRQVADQLRPKVPKLAALMDEAEADVLAFMSFPKDHRSKIHSINPLERLNGEIKRRTDVVGIFPNEGVITRLIGALLLEQNDEWAVQRRRYMSLETIAPLSDDPIIKLPAVAAA